MKTQNKDYIVHQGEHIDQIIGWLYGLDFNNPQERKDGYFVEEIQTTDSSLREYLGIKNELSIHALRVKVPPKKYVREHFHPEAEWFFAPEGLEIIVGDLEIGLTPNQAIQILPTIWHRLEPSENYTMFYAVKAMRSQSQPQKFYKRI